MQQAYQSDTVTFEDEMTKYIYALYSEVRDYYLEIHGQDPKTTDGIKNRDLIDISDEEKNKLNNCLEWLYTRYQNEHNSFLSDKMEEIISEAGLGQLNKNSAESAYRTYFARLDLQAAAEELHDAYERAAYIVYLTSLLELLQLPREHDARINSEAYTDKPDSVIESDTELVLIDSTDIDNCKHQSTTSLHNSTVLTKVGRISVHKLVNRFNSKWRRRNNKQVLKQSTAAKIEPASIQFLCSF